jgi:predicted transcriptional regulator of viral defense system
MPMSARERIAHLSRASHGGLVTIAQAAEGLGTSRKEAALVLAGLTRHGWLQRASRGLYLILPLEVEPGTPAVAEDPWILARGLFSPCYIGGWSAAEHWGLTEQLFRSTLVVTASSARSSSRTILDHEFRLFKVPKERITGATLVWRGSERVPVSSQERTIVDGLRHPELLGGIRHLTEILQTYRATAQDDFSKLIGELTAHANGAAWKRFGLLVEILWPEKTEVLSAVADHLTTGTIRLDPAVTRKGTLRRRWGVWVNVSVDRDSTV